MEANIVTEWLISLRLGQYAESFIDNGYDDLEICKQIGDPDLDAIGVFNPVHRNRLLQSVRTLREEGAASVYFSLEEAEKSSVSDGVNVQEQNFLSSSTNNSETDRHSTCSRTSGSDKGPSAPPAEEMSRYLDEYEEGKAELVKIPRMQLKVLLKEKLAQDGVKLSLQPYSTQICDPNLRILAINPRHGGATHDSYIWRTSAIRTELEREYQAGDRTSWLIGDSGYPLQPWLMTPVLNAAPNTPEARYTQAHSAARNCIERCNGLLKARYRCTNGERLLRYDPVMAGYIVTASAVLHNISLGDENIDLFEDEPVAVDVPNVQGGFVFNEGQRQRQRIIMQYFHN